MSDIAQMAEYLLTASLVFIVLALVCNLVVITTRREAPVKKRELVAAGVGGDEIVEDTSGKTANSGSNATNGKKARLSGLALYATVFAIISFVLVTVYIGVRIAVTGHGPFSNQHEFAVSFIAGILGAYLIAEFYFKIRVLSLVVLPVAGALTVYAMSLDTGVKPLVPALQNNLLLTLHVGFAMLAYGAACVSFGAAVIYLIYPKLKFKMPRRDLFDDIGYKAAVVTFPLLTTMILLGAVWANTAWGRYWGWDPKETAAFVTWLIYAAYLHARVTRGWQGKRSAWVLVVGFAAILFAYFGNHFLGGLHSYG
jgi:cytochrome c-type biogenesis protein CcsB